MIHKIQQRKQYYGSAGKWVDVVNLLGVVITYPSREAARVAVERYSNAPYEMGHNECGCPELRIARIARVKS